MTDNSLVLPLIHSNGSSRDNLLRDRYKVVLSITTTMESLAEMRPHQRDYYIREGEYERALVQHNRRMNILSALKRELLEEIDRLMPSE